MKRYGIALIIASVLALLPAVAYAENGDGEGVIFRVRGDITVPEGETEGVVFVIDGNVTIDGTVTEALIVIHGTATVRGRVEGEIYVIDGSLNLEEGSTVKNVTLIDTSEVNQEQGATVTGDIQEGEDFAISDRSWAWFGILFWFMSTGFILVAGLVFAAIGGGQLTRAALSLTSEPANTILGSVIVWVGLPIAAILILLTIIGVPVSIMLFMSLPVFAVLGYIVAGTRLGGAITGRLLKRSLGSHPYIEALVGLLLLQLLTLVPFLGWLVATLAGAWGAGAIALLAWRAVRGPRATPPPTADASTPVAAPTG